MRAYLSVFRMRMLTGMQYRAAALAGIATQFFWGFLLIMIYEAFYYNNKAAQPISLEQLIDFVWLQQAFLLFIVLWVRDWDIFNLITGGNISYELCRPCSIYGFWFAKLVAQRLSGALLRCSPIIVFAFLLPEPYRLSVPPESAAFFLFVVTLALGLLVLVSISMLIYISVFKTMSPVGSLIVFGAVGEFFSGMIIPIPLMPEKLKSIAYILPFRLASDLPFRIYSGNIQTAEALTGIAVQLAWLAALVLAGRAIMGRVLKKVVIQGG